MDFAHRDCCAHSVFAFIKRKRHGRFIFSKYLFYLHANGQLVFLLFFAFNTFDIPCHPGPYLFAGSFSLVTPSLLTLKLYAKLLITVIVFDITYHIIQVQVMHRTLAVFQHRLLIRTWLMVEIATKR